MPDTPCQRDGMVCTTHDAFFSSRQDRCEYEYFSDMDSGSPTMPDTLSREELAAIREHEAWASNGTVARLLAHIDALVAADSWWTERFRIMHRSDPAGRRAYLEMQARANDVAAEIERGEFEDTGYQ